MNCISVKDDPNYMNLYPKYFLCSRAEAQFTMHKITHDEISLFMFQAKAGFNEEPTETTYKRHNGGEAKGDRPTE
jgi:hypothetical protein